MKIFCFAKVNLDFEACRETEGFIYLRCDGSVKELFDETEDSETPCHDYRNNDKEYEAMMDLKP